MPMSSPAINIVLCRAARIADPADRRRIRAWRSSIVVGKVLANKSQTFGCFARLEQTEQYVDMLSAGIVDPAKVVQGCALHQTRLRSLGLSWSPETEAMVAEAPKKNAAPAMPGGGGNGRDGLLIAPIKRSDRGRGLMRPYS